MPDRVKQSRMIMRLDQEIGLASSSVEADCKRAERATYQARLGLSAQAKVELDALRRSYESRPQVQVSAWLNLLDGLIGHFSDMNTDARVRILRSHALSSAANLPYIRALSAAWLAHMEYLRLDIPSMADHAAEALLLSTVQHHSVRSRVGLVLAQAFHLAGRLELAMPWYATAHGHAIAEGDDATVSALMHNMAWLRAQRLRASDCGLSAEPTRSEEHALLAAESIANFDSLIGSRSLPALVPVLRAQILTVEKRYGEALALFEEEVTSAIQEGMGRLQADLLADQAWCRVQLGQRAAALRDANLARAAINVSGQFDDRALAYARLAKTFAALDQPDDARQSTELANEAWAAHVSLQKQILDTLKHSRELHRP